MHGSMFASYGFMLIGVIAPVVTAVAVWRMAESLKEIARNMELMARAIHNLKP